MNREKSDLYLLVALLGISLTLAYFILRPFTRPVVFAVIIGIGFYPLHKWIRSLTPRRNVSSLVTTLIVLTIFLVPTVLITSSASGDIVRAAQYIGSKTGEDGGFYSYVTHLLERPMNWLSKYVDLDESGIRAAVDSLPSRASRLLLATATPLVRGVASFAGDALITILVLFFVFRDGARATKRLASLLPMSRARVHRLFFLIHSSIVANLYGILAVALVQGVLASIAFALIGVRPLLLLAMAVAVFSLVPLVGSALVWLPVAISLFLTGHAWRAIFLIVWCVVVVGTADNIIRPLVIGGRVKLHPLVLLFSLIGGVQQFGFLGLFVGPIVMSLILAIIDMLREELRTAVPQTEQMEVN